MKKTRKDLMKALALLEKRYDENKEENGDEFDGDLDELALVCAKELRKKYKLSGDEFDAIKSSMDNIIQEVEDTGSDLSEFNLSQSGACDECGTVVLSGQNGFSLTEVEDKTLCDCCYLLALKADPTEENNRIFKLTMDGFTDYGHAVLKSRASSLYEF